MKKLLFVCFGVLVSMAISGCRDPLCPAVKPIVSKFSQVVITQCVCANAEQVVADMTRVLDSALVCDSGQGNQGIISSIVCPIAGSLVTGYIAGKIPASWECSNSLGCVGTVVSIAVAACEIIPFSPAP